MECVFCQIVNGELPAWLVHENEHAVAFLDRAPATRGHTLIATRLHRADLTEIDGCEAAAVMKLASQLARAAQGVLGATGSNLKQSNGEIAGQDVFHFHLHVIPRYPDDSVQFGCVWGMAP